MDKKIRILLSGGGTSGHSAPLLSIYNKIIDKFPNCEVYAIGVGSKEETEFLEKIPNYYKIKAGKKQNNIWCNIKESYKFIRGYYQAKTLLKKIKPDIIFSKGGFASFPVVIAARRLKIPFFLHESDIVMGKVNKIMSRWAKKIFVCFPPDFYPFISPEKIVFTGPILREGFGQDGGATNSNYFSFNDSAKGTIFLTGGSQGALNLSRNFLEIADKLLTKYNIIHQAGKHSIDISKQFEEKVPSELKNRYYLKEFFGVRDGFDEMLEAIKSADLIISRAGSTIAELAIEGKAMLLVPWQYSAQNHQEKNAQYLAEKGAAKVILENELDSSLLEKTIVNLMQDENELRRLSKNAKTIFPSNGAEIIVEGISNFLNGLK